MQIQSQKLAYLFVGMLTLLFSFPVRGEANKSLVQLAEEIGPQFKNPKPFDLGLYGKVGTASFYISTPQNIPTTDRLYWVMVRVLSEKYGCFMVDKDTSGDHTSFTCRDGRRIGFTRFLNPDFVAFVSRQYDKAGYELVVNNRKIIQRIDR